MVADDDHARDNVVLAVRQADGERDEEHWVMEKETAGMGVMTAADVGSGPHDPPDDAGHDDAVDVAVDIAISAADVLVASGTDSNTGWAMRSSVRGLSSRGSETSGIALETGFPSETGDDGGIDTGVKPLYGGGGDSGFSVTDAAEDITGSSSSRSSNVTELP